jgi:hypothetical protein
MERNRRAWLSLTPEPEHQLPRAIAALRTGGDPSPEAVAAESERIERLVLGGRRQSWERWLRETRELAVRQSEARPADARLALDVIDNHDALVLGLERRQRGTDSR